ncbi:thioesterase, partial [Sistotremastrum niveocremeum HHB9708]
MSLKQRTRKSYKYSLPYRTRWSDNDQYGHMNNSIYYHLFDSIINAYLISHCAQDPLNSPTIGLVVSSHCQFFAPLAFPTCLELCLRVNKLGKSSVEYEVGVFEDGVEEVRAVGGYTHVFVDAKTRKSISLRDKTREGLRNLLVDETSKL